MVREILKKKVEFTGGDSIMSKRDKERLINKRIDGQMECKTGRP